MRPWSIKVWRTVAIIAIASCVALTLAVGYVALSFASNLRTISRGTQVCLAGDRAYDSVAAAQMIGRLDLVSFLLTAGGLLLAIFALIGFWMIRTEAIDEASRVASDEARRIAQNYYGVDENEKGTHINDEISGRRRPRRGTRPSVEGVRMSAVQEPEYDPSTVSVAGATEEGQGDADA